MRVNAQGRIMQSHPSTLKTYVNTQPTFKLGNIWDRDFAKQIRQVGKDNGIFINIRKELKAIVGKSFDTLDVLIDLAKRYGNGFHHSNTEILHSIDNSISESKLYRDKKELIQLGILHIKNGVKNRSMYYLHPEWFKAFISGVFSKLGILQRQNDRSHIISNDHINVIHSHNHYDDDKFKKAQRTEPPKPTEPIQPNSATELKTPLAKQIATLTDEERALFDTLKSYGIVVPLIVIFIRKYNLNQIYEKIENAKNHVVNPNKMGSYIRQSLANLETDHQTSLTYADTSGKVTKSRTEDIAMGRPTTPAPTASQTWRTLSEADDNFRQAKKPASKEAAKTAIELIKSLNLRNKAK